jgi:CubicO group peptidase (beta-lactamase class C family)
MTSVVGGVCRPGFEPLREAFTANFEDGLELGATLALSVRGERVVDLWAGWADPERTRPLKPDHLMPVASTTKIMITLCLLMLVGRGKLDLDSPIATWWPQFAQGGKGAVTLRDLFSHETGAPGFDPPVTQSLMLDWDAVTTRLAAERHWFEGERRVIYHAMTYGLIGGELIRRVDGRMPAAFFREELAGPAGLDFAIGVPEVTDPARLAGMIPPHPRPADAPEPSALQARLGRSVTWVEGLAPPMTLNPSGNGFGNGRSIARAGAIMAGGGALDGVRYIPAELVREAWREQSWGECPYLGWIKFGLGFGLDSTAFRQPSRNGFSWGGVGGSICVMDETLGYSLGYAPNNWAVWAHRADPRPERLYRAMANVAERL